MTRQSSSGRPKPNSTPTTHKVLETFVGFVIRKIEKLALNTDEFLSELQSRIRGQHQPLVSVTFGTLKIITGIQDAVDEYREAIGYAPGGELVHFKNGQVKKVSLSESVKLFRDIAVLWLTVDHKFNSHQDTKAYLRWLSDLEAAMCRSFTERGTALLMIEASADSYGMLAAAVVAGAGKTVEDVAARLLNNGDELVNWAGTGYAPLKAERK